MNQASYSPINAMIDIVAAPGRALDEVKSRTRWLWIPLFTTMGLSIGVFAWYYNWVDLGWIVDQQIRALPPDAPTEQVRQVRDFTSVRMLTILTSVGIVLGTTVIYAVQAGYLHLANKLTSDVELKYGQWFSFTTWTSFVSIFAIALMVATMLVADDNQLRQDELVPISMNQLFVHAEPGDKWFTWASSLTLINFWTLGLMTIGWHRWVGTTIGAAAVIVCLPWVLIFGMWALLI